MDSDRLAEMAKYFEEYFHGNPLSAESKQAGILFRSLARAEYELQSETYRCQVTLDQYRVTELIPAIHEFLDHRQTKFPTPTPEKGKFN
jgi:hypothetical protein